MASPNALPIFLALTQSPTGNMGISPAAVLSAVNASSFAVVPMAETTLAATTKRSLPFGSVYVTPSRSTRFTAAPNLTSTPYFSSCSVNTLRLPPPNFFTSFSERLSNTTFFPSAARWIAASQPVSPPPITATSFPSGTGGPYSPYISNTSMACSPPGTSKIILLAPTAAIITSGAIRSISVASPNVFVSNATPAFCACRIS